ncbi:hypothetical protein BP6252_03657 [Coleophoma cylindrospora]|uniref:Uncharacterized protein n=1 Tax=Coleophoma cylindrospora TaxID=1849047 RepID=A0A3D8S876_9HELO|nr:hypothetical protein BP6252_03657 [Coleophoma cylindrospora]
MGVTGLWSIVQPCARPIKLETLNRKRLAVDASIWIYQFLKAVRDKEGNALRNSHVVGFFRRICKLLFFGIKPVFVFDGGAPVLKRQTILGRKKRREGRREDAVRTAGKLLAVQMQRRGEEEAEKRKKERGLAQARTTVEDGEEPLPADLVYVDEIGMSNTERQKTRQFRKTDAYHLPDLTNGIEGMGQPNDPRIMSAEELEDYARQFHNGEDVNLYDFSKIDFNGEFFMSLPAGDRYNILNAARLRSRLRMGLSKEQLEEMFPDRMAFSRFQIERVRERNELTQRLMNLNGMNDVDTLSGSGRIAGERGREYVLVKNDGVEGGWALGVVSTDKSAGERNKPIDVDALHQEVKRDEAEESEDDFEDVPVEGLNRLPKMKTDGPQNPTYDSFQAQELARQRKQLYNSRNEAGPSKRQRTEAEDTDSLFVDSEMPTVSNPVYDSEEEDLNRAIAMSLQKEDSPAGDSDENHLNEAIALSLQKNHRQVFEPEDDFEEIMMPQYEQRAVEAPKPIVNNSGRMVAHIVNNRANAAVPKRRSAESDDSDSDMDLQSALAAARKQKAPARRSKPAPVPTNQKNPFDGPLPFEKLDFKSSIFGRKLHGPKAVVKAPEGEDVDDEAGGFENGPAEDAPKPLPPWLVGSGDIRSQVEEQQKRDLELNIADRERAMEEDRIFQRDHGIIELESSDDNDSDVEIVSAPSPRLPAAATTKDVAEVARASLITEEIAEDVQGALEKDEVLPQIEMNGNDGKAVDWSESEYEDTVVKERKTIDDTPLTEEHAGKSSSQSPLPEFEDVEVPEPASNMENSLNPALRPSSISPEFEDVSMPDAGAAFSSSLHEIPALPNEDTFDRQDNDGEHVDFGDFSDPEDEELLAQLATEAEEHARFASTLNNKSERENQEAYERELKQLRSQQKKDRRDADEVSHIMVTECQALLRLFGIPYITAPMEAEAQCAELVSLGLVDGIVTDDSDIFLFGGTRVYKNMFNSNKFVECYLSADLEKELSLSREQLIAVAHLLGSDYTEGLPGVGPVTALEIISEFPSAEGLQSFKEWWAASQHSKKPLPEDIGSTFRKKFRRSQATKLFLPPAFPSPAVTEAYMKPDVDSTPEPFQWGVPDLDRLRDFLMATIGWSQERTDEVLVPVIRDMNRRETEGTQSNITRFFDGGVGLGAQSIAREKDIGSKRMKDAVSKLRARKSGSARGSTPALSSTFGDEAAQWAKTNDLSFTEREREKSMKGRGKKGKKTASVAPEIETEDADDESLGVENDDVEAENRSVGKDKASGKRKRTTS